MQDKNLFSRTPTHFGISLYMYVKTGSTYPDLFGKSQAIGIALYLLEGIRGDLRERIRYTLKPVNQKDSYIKAQRGFTIRYKCQPKRDT